jgi:hypothetical protein
MSDYVGLPPNLNIARYLVTKLERNDTHLDLDSLPLEKEGSKEAVPVAACLRGLTCFSTIHSSLSNDVVPFVCYALRSISAFSIILLRSIFSYDIFSLRYSQSISSLRLVSKRADVEELGRAMKANPNMSLQVLSLSLSLSTDDFFCVFFPLNAHRKR